MEYPGACSPSRKVVSKTVSRSPAMVCLLDRPILGWRRGVDKVIILTVSLGMLMNIAEIQVFLSIAAERSFSKAASKLNRTQSAVSQALKRLEDQLGEQLIDRSTKDGRLTR